MDEGGGWGLLAVSAPKPPRPPLPIGDTGDSLELGDLAADMAFMGTPAFFSGRPDRLRLSRSMFRLLTLPHAFGITSAVDADPAGGCLAAAAGCGSMAEAGCGLMRVGGRDVGAPPNRSPTPLPIGGAETRFGMSVKAVIEDAAIENNEITLLDPDLVLSLGVHISNVLEFIRLLSMIISLMH